ncbi:MAG: PspC domain-containing protein [Galactobacter sp.]
MLNGFFNLLRRQSLRRGPRRILGGVCHGISRSVGCDPGLVRLIAMVALLLPFVSWVAYALAWLLIPYRDGSIVLERLVDGAAERRRN